MCHRSDFVLSSRVEDPTPTQGHAPVIGLLLGLSGEKKVAEKKAAAKRRKREQKKRAQERRGGGKAAAEVMPVPEEDAPPPPRRDNSALNASLQAFAEVCGGLQTCPAPC